jgi:molybdate transport system substrate-binding protein
MSRSKVTDEGEHVVRSVLGRAFAAFVLVVLLASGCSHSSKDKEETVSGPVSGPVIVFGAPALTPAVHRLVAAFQKKNPKAKMDVTIQPPAQLVQTAKTKSPDVILDRPCCLNGLQNTGPGLDKLRPLGRDLYVIATPKNNPAVVGDVSVFAASSTKKTAVCGVPTVFGDLATLVLAKASVVPAQGAVKQCNSADVIRRLRAGELDAALIMRSEVQAQAGNISMIPLPDADNIAVDAVYATARGRPGGDRFAALIQSSTGQQILERSGLLP